MPRWCGLALRVAIVVFLVVTVAWGSMWAYIAYEALRTKSLLTEVSQIRIGDTEASITPLVERYGGFKWTREPLSPKENWISEEEYEYQQSRQSDYQYEIQISPFETVFRRTGWLTQALRTVRTVFPARVRPILGMRDWGAVAELSVRSSHVQSVSTVILVVGRSGWTGYSWELAEGMPVHDIHQQTYAIGAAFLTMPDAGNHGMLENYFTPKSSEEEARAARGFNARCLISIKGCEGFCDIAPTAIEYLRLHPDAAWNIIPPKCP